MTRYSLKMPAKKACKCIPLEWVPLQERYPITNQPVIVYGESIYGLAYWNDNQWVKETMSSNPTRITHWRPIPPYYEKVSKDGNTSKMRPHRNKMGKAKR